MFNETALRMFASAPVFGVGVDQYYLQSERFAPEALLSSYRRVPAHNPFLQHAAELGIIGVAPFTWIIGAALWTCVATVRRGRHDAYLLGALAGLTAFVITSFSSGHPLLLEVTAYPFWIALGLAAGRATLLQPDAARAPAARPRWDLAPRAIAAAVLLVAVSIPLRVAAQNRGIDFSEVTYGLHHREDNGRYGYRWTSGHATLFIDGDARDVELPLLAPLIERTGPMHVDILLNGRLANQVDLSTPDWRNVNVLPAAIGSALPHRGLARQSDVGSQRASARQHRLARAGRHARRSPRDGRNACPPGRKSRRAGRLVVAIAGSR